MPLTLMLVWATVATTVMGLGHLYVWRRLVRDAALPRPFSAGLAALFVALLVGQLAAMVAGRGLPRDAAEPWAYGAFLWMGLLSTFFSLLVATDLVLLAVRLTRRLRDRVSAKEPPEQPEPERLGRRQALGRLVAGGVAVGGVTLGAAGVAGASSFTLRRVSITLDRLPRAFDGLRIVQLSDVHVGPTIGRAFVERMVAAALGEQPDLMVITGDLVDGSVANLRQHTEPLRELRARYGVYFVTGNHEYYSGVEEWVTEVERLGIRVLRNDAVRLESGGGSLLLAGVTDHRAASFGDAPDFERALRSRRPGEEVVLLAHQPAAVHEAARHDVGLQLSGHTHGGQFWPWNWAVHLVQPVVAGLARFGRTQVYVNTGTGYWGPPMRVGTESEITLVTLRSPAPGRLAPAAVP